MKKHDDAKQDKVLVNKLLNKSVKPLKVAKHLKKDIKEQKKGIKEDKSLMKSFKYGKK